jgi:hypothetical protein
MSTPVTFVGQDATDVFNAFSAVFNALHIATTYDDCAD